VQAAIDGALRESEQNSDPRDRQTREIVQLYYLCGTRVIGFELPQRRIKFDGSQSIRRFDWKCWTGVDQARRSFCSDATFPRMPTTSSPRS